MAMIQRILPLTITTTPQSIFSFSTLRAKTLLNPLHHHSLLPLQTPLTTFKTYSIDSSEREIFSVLPSPFTLTHHMKLRFVFPTKDYREKVAKLDPRSETATAFLECSEPRQLCRPLIGDGEDGGGIALYIVPWGRRALFLANEVLSEFGDDFKLYVFRTAPDGRHVQVRIESLSHEYGCPSVEMLASFFRKYWKRLVEDSASGIIPDDFGLEVRCPGLGRLLKVPDDLSRFKHLPMRVFYIESDGKEGESVFFLCSVEKGCCIWYLSDFDPMNKDRPVSRKEGSPPLKLRFAAHIRVTIVIQQ